ncbi:TetR/AcrR family transcriptional regulator [Gottfriedia acidiceleris]|uniref:TetR/AcrR family transcriptional regulator n=1 Tax=Gottfriedia acidiceleris TaxID=371036 RepID=A0ABY4JLE9_9BACI|nr:TetR/AcrR family transcriptional regulator [Gottfriedia acidiceleris]UPM54322.1 TetR/AcrR family transcriptional regulator [Gottfriedia acidiceleris]
MNDRKQHVVKIAHELFIEKGFQATSIQDILEYSGISKGTFYNYFSSKSDLVVALFNMIYKKLEHERNELLIGQSPSNIEIFIKQITLLMEANRDNKLISLFEEVIYINDLDIKQFIREGNFKTLNWVYTRFLDIFGSEKKDFLLDSAIMFLGIIHHNVRYYDLAKDMNISMDQVVRYSVKRIIKIVEDVEESGEQLFNLELLDRWLPVRKTEENLQQKLSSIICTMKKSALNSNEQQKYNELLDFLQNELLQSKTPRKYLIESALVSLNEGKMLLGEKELQRLNELIDINFIQHVK